jgi:ribulose-phosphate 3-epimerase
MVKKIIAAPSVMCANLKRLEDDLRALAESGADELHFDIMDGSFVPNFTLGFDFIRAAKACCDLPCSAHLMVTHPEEYIARFAAAGCDVITVHSETCPHAHRTLNQIRDAGASPGIAINPATPLTKIDYLLPESDRVLVMSVDPGYAGQKIIPSAFERVDILARNIRYHEYRTKIEVDGNIDVHNCARLANAGAEIFVLGTAGIFRDDGTELREALPAFRKAVAAKRAALA